MKIHHKNENNLRIVNHTITEFDGKEKYPLWLENCNNVTIENVHVLKSDLTGLTIKNCRNVTLKNCTFQGSIKVQGLGIQLTNSTAITLEKVTCQKNANVGIHIESSHDVTIISSNLLENVRDGLKITDSNNITIKNSTFDGSVKEQGITLSNASVIHLEKLTIRNNAKTGIEIQQGSHDISIIASECSDNAEAGLRLVDSRNVTGRDLKINRTQNGNGLWFQEGQQLEFINCHFDNNDSGIHLQNCAGVVFTTSTFSQNKTGNGIFLSEVENAQFQYCQFNNNNYGLVLVKSENVSFQDSQIHFNHQGYGKIAESVVEIIDD